MSKELDRPEMTLHDLVTKCGTEPVNTGYLLYGLTLIELQAKGTALTKDAVLKALTARISLEASERHQDSPVVQTLCLIRQNVEAEYRPIH